MTKCRVSSVTYPAMLAAALGLSLASCDGMDARPKAPPKPTSPRTYGKATSVNAAPSVDPRAVLTKVKLLMPPLEPEATNPANPWSKAKADLGRMLYYDARLSKNHDVSCNTCHDLASFGVDVRKEGGRRIPTSLGHKGAKGDRNSPTVYNSAFQLAQFWDGRAADVEEQAKGPVLNPVEMAMADEASVVSTLKSIPGYAEPFKAAFPDDADPISYDNMAKAIGSFERKLVTPGRFDEFVGGKLDALTPAEVAGLDTFVDVGCTQCHSGALLGGSQFQKLGSVKPWPGNEDTGRFALTKAVPDKFVFKVPTLRNIAETGPYLHDGSIASLSSMVEKMSEHQLAKGKLSKQEVASIVAFLGALTGKVDQTYVAKPQLPPSGPQTPAADPS